jgi:predicted aldo/keto reductase-like oxidoreductase
VKYRVNPKNGDNLSTLGYGAMRLPKDEKLAGELLGYAIENGVNYIDTAYMYAGNEALLGRILSEKDSQGTLRDCVKIATKMPPYLVGKREDFDKLFNIELERLRTDHVDYYLIHMLTDVAVWERFKSLGFLEWLHQKRESGQIINLGFSYHGGKDEFLKLLDAHDWDFCMIQYNYYDENNQAGKAGLLAASARGLPVMIMEPLRGGKLVNGMPKSVYEIFDGAHVKRSPVEWALRWVWNHPQVTTVLSGMNSMAMLKENLRIASDAEPEDFTERDFELFAKIRQLIEDAMLAPCTGCGYCMPCPKGVDIPTCFTSLNDIAIEGKRRAFTKYLMYTAATKESSEASRCVKCGKCEKHCPQGIPIREKLELVQKELEGVLYKPARFFVKKFMRFS